jgi:hypothetical protein
MRPEDIRKLLGGYATGTLTEAEQQALFAAALEDQELFDALANEQPLRDLLTDPSARAALLSSLDTPASRLGGFWQWLRRPLVVGLSTAGVVAIAVVAVWQGTRVAGVKPAPPQIVAELRSQAPGPVPFPAEVPSPAMRSEAGKRNKVVELPPPTRLADEKAKSVVARPQAAPPPSPSAGMQALNPRKEETDVAAPAVAPPPASAEPAFARKKEAVEVTAAAPFATQIAGAAPANAPLDARAIFYADQAAQAGNGFRPLTGQKDAAPRPERAAAGLLKSVTATLPRLGVRISILRGAGEADLTTVLDPDETVRLKLIPNADGFLYIAEGARLVASGAVQRLKPFETPELRFTGSGQKHLYVMFSRRPQTVDPASLGTVARGNLVETSAEPERATYVVSGAGDAAAQQVIVPVTLTYR